MKKHGLAALLLLLATTGDAQQAFRAAISGEDSLCIPITVPFIPTLEWIAPDSVDSSSDVAMIASGDGLRVFGVLAGTGTRVVQVTPSGTQTPFYEDLTTTAAGSITVGADGRVFVAFFRGSFQLAVISAAGGLEATYPFPIPQFPRSMQVADDGCTIFYITIGSAVHRIDGCTGALLPDFLLAPNVSDVDPLPNGEVLVARGDSVSLHNAAGGFMRTVGSLPSYGLPSRGVTQVAASADMSEVWLTANDCDTRLLLRIAFSNGAEISRRAIVPNQPNALVLGAGLTDVPAAGVAAMLLVVIGIAAVAVSRL